MEKEEEIATVLSNAFTAHSFKTLLPENEENTTSVVLSPDHFLWMQVKLVIIRIQHWRNGQSKNQKGRQNLPVEQSLPFSGVGQMAQQ